VIQVARINSAIGAVGSITGSFSVEDTKELALLLKSGAFAAPVVFEEERQVDPLLGAESIKYGLLSCLVALLALFVFSAVFYSLCGMAAFSALLLNLVFLLVGMRLLGATLTLPGIEGIVLTVGMAIDASILIFERVRELVREGREPLKAIQEGFSGAMVVILDANITTFIVAAVLYYFGTGPLKGFAITMMLGIVTTLLTGIFYLRSLFSYILTNFRVQKLSI
jgi:preprotein translocase subunit SecD